MTRKRNLDGVIDAVRGAETIALCAHMNPDGDTLGSCLALRLALLSLGKAADVFCDDRVPDNLRFMPGADTVRRADEAAAHYDLLLAVDVSDERRMGSAAALRERCASTAQVDHHGTNPGFMAANCVDPEASATGLVVRELLARLGVALTPDIALCLYVAISTDTGNFSFSNTTVEAFETAGELLAQGLPLSRLNRALFQERSREQTLLLGRALNSLRFDQAGRIAVMTLAQADFDACGAKQEHAEAIVNFGLNVTGVKLAALVRENGAGGVKASLRAVEPYRVDTVAAALGGGGHLLAAGCSLSDSLINAASRVLAALIEEAEKHDK